VRIREKLSHYAAFDGSPKEPLTFDDPDDWLNFVQSQSTQISADARKGHESHGRGIVMLQKTSSMFIESHYVTPGPGDLDRLGSGATEDFEAYDPETQMLVGITSPDGAFVDLWKLELP
jgi:hypothetical protein